MNKTVDFVVIGSGIAGLNAALHLSSFGKVLVVTKRKINDAATNVAQGGIAAVTTKEDTFDSHIHDTLKAGSYHNKKDVVDFLVREGPHAIEQLVNIGVPFDRKRDGSFAASYEAAHSYPRVLHATDFTGKEIESAFIHAILKNNNIEVWEHAFALDLIVEKNSCFGVQVICNREIIPVYSQVTVLATGGVGQVYQWTTNPAVATGDGIAMAYRAGARLADLEFIQFHPTALKEITSPLFLLSEALRGEGGVLVDISGKRFMEGVHPQKELAPRDIVARAIFEKMRKSDVFLDIRHKGKTFLVKRFPNIYAELLKKGFDLARDLIPVTPAAHFLCGGIATDLQGRTSIKNLFACGEVATTGVHGANRLASNSLLEGMVFSEQIVKSIQAMLEKENSSRTSNLHPQNPSSHFQHPASKRDFDIRYSECTIRYVPSDVKLDDIHNDIKNIMWLYAGIERTPDGLLSGIKRLEKLSEIVNNVPEFGANERVMEVKNMIQTSQLICKAAYNRKESLGTHYIVEST